MQFILNTKKLKCETKKCKYVIRNLKFEDYKKYVGVKCPNCGQILLTEEDYNLNCRMKKVIEIEKENKKHKTKTKKYVDGIKVSDFDKFGFGL